MLKSSTRPRSSPGQIVPLYRTAIIAERRRLREAGKDYGPTSIRYALLRAGIPGIPSRSTIAKVLDEEHLVDRNRRKRPKVSF